MLLVTFHGGSAANAINQVFAYDTGNKSLLTSSAPSNPNDVKLDELRGMMTATGSLYVASGAKGNSGVLRYTIPISGPSFACDSTLVAAALDSHGHFTTSISHPFGVAFDSR